MALDNVDLEVRPGTVHALVGANGAGKSTLIKILTGYYSTYQGSIEMDGKPVRITRPADAMALGIEVVHQEVDTTLIPYLTAAENLLIQEIALGSGSPMVNWSQLYARAQEMVDRVGLQIDVRRQVEDLTLHEKQLLVIARAVSRNVRYLILDEPTASLSLREVDRLFEIVKSLRAEGVGLIYVSHRLAEVAELADEITVMRNGRKVATFSGQVEMSRVVEAMLGAPAESAFPERPPYQPGPVVMEAEGLTRGNRVRGVSFQLHQGEILGITGMVGAGKTELLRLIFGADRLDAGEVRVDGRSVRLQIPQDAVRHGIFLVPEERRRQGLMVENTVRENIVLPFLEMFSSLGWMRRNLEVAAAQNQITALGVRPPRPEMPVKNLSGGNQQKVVVGKWLNRRPRVMIFDEATQGVDVGAKRDIYDLARSLTQEAGVIYASSDIDEVLGLADRVLVMRDGVVVAELSADEADRQVVLEYATGTRT